MPGLVMRLKNSYFWVSFKVGKYTKRRTRGEFEPQTKRYYKEIYRNGTYLEPAALARARSTPASKAPSASPISPYWLPRRHSQCDVYSVAVTPPAVVRRSKATVKKKTVVRSSEQYNFA